MPFQKVVNMPISLNVNVNHIIILQTIVKSRIAQISLLTCSKRSNEYIIMSVCIYLDIIVYYF